MTILLRYQQKFYKLKRSAAETEKAQALESLKEFDKKKQKTEEKKDTLLLPQQARRTL